MSSGRSSSNRGPYRKSRSSSRHGQGSGRSRHSRNRRPRRQPRPSLPAPRPAEVKQSFWQRWLWGSPKKPAERFVMDQIEQGDMAEIQFIPALFSKFPELVGSIPWVALRSSKRASAPRRLMSSQHLFGSNTVFVKNELEDADLISENNARKLEFVLAKLLENKPKRLISFERLGSSNALALALAGSYLKVPVELHLLRDSLSVESVQDLLEMKKYGARVELYSSERSFELQQKWSKVWASWRSAVLMPRGAFWLESVLGYINVSLELKAQIDEGLIPDPDLLVLPVSRGVSLVGLEIGRRLAGLSRMRIMAVPSLGQSRLSGVELCDLADNCLKLLNQHLKTPLEMTFSERDFQFYEHGSDDWRRQKMKIFMQRMVELESVYLDFEYSANAMFALHEMASEKLEGLQILFWNSFPGNRQREVPQMSDLERFPSWLRKDYEALLPAAILERSKTQRRQRRQDSQRFSQGRRRPRRNPRANRRN